MIKIFLYGAMGLWGKKSAIKVCGIQILSTCLPFDHIDYGTSTTILTRGLLN